MSNSLTLQDVFDAGVRGIVAQGTYAHDGVTCAYRTAKYAEDGSFFEVRCAIGHSIPDDVYEPGELEGHGIYVLLTADDDRYVAIKALFDGLNAETLSAFQSCHDGPGQEAFAEGDGPEQFMPEFLRRAREFAARNDLAWPSDVPRPL